MLFPAREATKEARELTSDASSLALFVSQTEWVPHAVRTPSLHSYISSSITPIQANPFFLPSNRKQWLQANSQPRLRNFLATGSQLQLLVAGAESAEKGDGEPSVADLLGSGPPEERRESALHKNQVQAAVFSFGSTPVADPDAETRLPEAWKTFDRILDVYVAIGTKSNRKKASVVTSEEEESEVEEQDPKMQGVQPYVEEMIQIDEWEKKNGKLDAKTAVKAVVWCYVKCGDLPYSEGDFASFLSLLSPSLAVVSPSLFDSPSKLPDLFTRALSSIHR